MIPKKNVNKELLQCKLNPMMILNLIDELLKMINKNFQLNVSKTLAALANVKLNSSRSVMPTVTES